MTPPDGEKYTLTDKKAIKTLEDIIRAFKDSNIILIGGFAVSIYSYLNGDDYYKFRSTGDIDFVADSKDKTNIIANAYKYFPNANIKEGKIFGYDGVEIKVKNGVSISILFKDSDIPYNTIETKINNKKLRLNVAKLEYLLVDKIFTYLKRRKEKDIEDIEEIAKILNKNGYDQNLLNDIFSEYSEKYEKYSDEAKKLMEEYLYQKSTIKL